MRWMEWVLFAYGVILTVIGVIWGYFAEVPIKVAWQIAVLSLVMGGLALGYIAYSRARTLK